MSQYLTVCARVASALLATANMGMVGCLAASSFCG